jgi:carbonic anhydrase
MTRPLVIPFAVCITLACYSVAGAQSTHTASAHPAHWSYAGAEGPDAWASLDHAFATCSTGVRQSPIDLSATSSEEAPANIAFNYARDGATVANNGHTIQATFGHAGTMRYNGKDYQLLQLHYHAPSEHIIDGKPAALEIHMVHRAADGTLAVVGTLFDVDTTEDSVVAALIRGAHGSKALIDPAQLVAPDASYFAYDGSLTTPPCSEGVKWIVLRAHRSLTKAQLAALQHVLGPNARPVLPRSGRKVVVAQ